METSQVGKPGRMDPTVTKGLHTLGGGGSCGWGMYMYCIGDDLDLKGMAGSLSQDC